MSKTILIRPNGDRLFIDAAVSVNRQFPNRVTSHPVEDGTDISDHVVNDPRVFSIEGVISDAAFQLDADNDPIPGGPGRSVLAAFTLEDMRDNGELLTLETPNDIYFDVIITDLSIPRDAQTGKSLVFTITLQQITTVERQFAEVPESRLSAGASDKGAQNAETGRQPKQNCDPNRNRSAALALVESLAASAGADPGDRVDAAIEAACGES